MKNIVTKGKVLFASGISQLAGWICWYFSPADCFLFLLCFGAYCEEYMFILGLTTIDTKFTVRIGKEFILL